MKSLIPDDYDEPVTVTEYGIMTSNGEVASGFLDPTMIFDACRNQSDLTLVSREVTFTVWRTAPLPAIRRGSLGRAPGRQP